MKRRERFLALAVVLTASAACERAALPTATPENSSPLLDVAAASVTSFPIPTPNSGPRHIALGSDGNMWFTESNANQIARLNPDDGTITEFVVPTVFAQPDDIASEADGPLWFTEPSGFPNGIGRVTTKGKFKEFGPDCDPNGGCSIVPEGITIGPDGNIWFTEQVRNAIVKFEPMGKRFTFYPIPTPGANPHGITVGPDGALWFTEFNANTIGRIDLAGNITEFGGVTGSPDRITAGPDGNLWFTEPFPFDSRIGRITPSGGVITEFQLASGSQPRDIVTGPDGNLWFTEYGAGQLARITPDGVVTEVQPLSRPWGIGRGAGNTLWITHIDDNLITRFTVSP